jgi:hypothetical protein
MLWTGRIISAIPILMMGVLGVVFYFANRAEFMKGLTDHGYPEKVALPLLIVEVSCVLIYAIPQTAVLGAILLTGYLGGAVATHVRVSEPEWPMAVAMGCLVWLGLLLRDGRLRQLLPFRR